ncbi:Protein ELF4-LIKE 4 [Glycine max]|nr:Protein ELF4-LIKE 4 [Glycine max]
MLHFLKVRSHSWVLQKFASFRFWVSWTYSGIDLAFGIPTTVVVRCLFCVVLCVLFPPLYHLDFIGNSKRKSVIEMDGDIFGELGNSTQVDSRLLQVFQKSLLQAQDILNQNRLLINEINQNHESKMPDNLSRNVGLIRELNSNIRRVVDLYADLSNSFTKSREASSEGDSSGTLKSDGKVNQKRIRSS